MDEQPDPEKLVKQGTRTKVSTWQAAKTITKGLLADLRVLVARLWRRVRRGKEGT